MAALAFRVKTKIGHQIVNHLTKNNTIKELKQELSKISNIPVQRLHVLAGFPPKVMDISQDELPLGSSGLASGDTLILEEKIQVTHPSPQEANVPKKPVVQSKNDQENLISSPGILMKHIVPADNSCLFTSVNFVLNGKTDETGEAAPFLRQVVAETIRNDINYDEAILGKPVEEYCRWILDDKSWGGAIELAILSNYYGIEIAVVDTINAIINKFGEDQNYPLRVFLLFDGIHYDPLYLEPYDGSKVMTLFESTDEQILREAETLAHEAKSSRQYTDVNKFTLKCMVCNVLFKGQVEAQTHARETGHANFGEV